jgi:glycogen synthase
LKVNNFDPKVRSLNKMIWKRLRNLRDYQTEQFKYNREESKIESGVYAEDRSRIAEMEDETNRQFLAKIEENQTMRALIISWEHPPYVVGGMGKHVAELMPHLGGRPIRDDQLFIDIVTTRYGGGAAVEKIDEHITVYRVDLPAIDTRDWYNSVLANNAPLSEFARQLASETPYDLIHIHDWLTGVAGVTLKHEWKIPLLVTIHATERGRHQGYLSSYTSHQIDRLEWKICFEAWRVIVCSHFMCQEVHEYFGVPLDKIDVIPNGVALDPTPCDGAEDQRSLRQRYSSRDEKLLFFVGRIVHEKGVHLLIQAMPYILNQYPNTRLLIAGKNGQKMWSLAHELGVERNIEFLGFISNEERDCLYQVVDAAVFPSLYEPFGIVALEAMGRGCNVIAASVGGLAEVVQHQQNGLTVYPNDPQSIAWAVNELFSHPEQAASWRSYAQEEVQTRYRWDRIATETAAVYGRVYEERQETNW